MMPALQRIEQRRLALKISRTELERAAGLSANYLSAVAASRYVPRESTLARLNTALSNIAKKRGGGDMPDFPLTVAYRLALIVAAHTLGHDASAAQAADPSRRATQCPDWMKAAEVRRLALYLLTSECGFSQSEVARAAGLTKQAVSEICRDMEAIRDEGSAFEAMVDTLRNWIMGEVE